MCKTQAVLIVEDEAFVAWDLAQTLETSTRTVVGPAHNLVSGFRLATEEHICAAVLDINLGDEIVWPLAEELSGRGIPFGFVSANLQHAELQGRFADAPKLSKPVRDRDLIAMVDQLMAQSNC